MERSGWIAETEPNEAGPDQVRWHFYALRPEGSRGYRVLTRILPPAFRARHGADLEQVLSSLLCSVSATDSVTYGAVAAVLGWWPFWPAGSRR